MAVFKMQKVQKSGSHKNTQTIPIFIIINYLPKVLWCSEGSGEGGLLRAAVRRGRQKLGHSGKNEADKRASGISRLFGAANCSLPQRRWTTLCRRQSI